MRSGYGLTLERVFDEVAASVEMVRRAVQPASIKGATPVHRGRRSHGERAVAYFDVQTLDGKGHAPVPVMPSQHQPPSNEIGALGTHDGGVAAAKFVSSAREWTCASLARAVTAGEPVVLVQCLATRAKGIGPHCKTVSTEDVGSLGHGTHAVGQPDDSVHRASLEEVIACRVSVRALEPDVLRSRVRVAVRDPPSGGVGYVRDRSGGAPLGVR